MHAEGELRNNLDDSERVKELQDKVAELKAEVSLLVNSIRSSDSDIAVRVYG